MLKISLSFLLLLSLSLLFFFIIPCPILFYCPLSSLHIHYFTSPALPYFPSSTSSLLLSLFYCSSPHFPLLSPSHHVHFYPLLSLHNFFPLLLHPFLFPVFSYLLHPISLTISRPLPSLFFNLTPLLPLFDTLPLPLLSSRFLSREKSTKNELTPDRNYKNLCSGL